MQKWSVLFVAAGLALAAVLPAAAQSSVFISEMCDAHLNYTTDRFIEIYNA